VIAPSPRGLAIAALTALVALVVLRALWRKLGWVDDGSDAPERKLQRTGVPLVGGPALLVAAFVLLFGSWDERWAVTDPPRGWSFELIPFLAGLLAAFLTGFVDDVRERGLSAGAKLVGQCVAAAFLALGVLVHGDAASFGERVLVFALAVAAQNVANAFDHADGALSSVAFAGLAAAGASLAGALLAFLPFNLIRKRADGPPLAYLGDSGSHLIGLLLLASAWGWAALTLPALDLARVVVERARAGVPIWRGDRRHLAQRLQAGGRPPLARVVLVLLCAAPAFAALALASRAGFTFGTALGLGAAGTALALVVVLRFHPPAADAA
jgi:UDP-N-acetylmuramyl pentapeptide phosphotransferase/UDP-N-acetylglucosamine-1-phosphate transferase